MTTSSSLWLPCTQMQHHDTNPPLGIVRGKGVYLYDAQGKSYLDSISSWWVNLHGHCHPDINSQIKAQLDTLEHTLLASVVHPQIETLADKLIALAPHSENKRLTKAFFADSGSAAIECALKMSLQSWQQRGFTQKQTFVSLEHGYHGETLGSLAVTDIPLFSKQFAPLLIQHLRAPSPSNLFCPKGKTQEEHEADCLQQLEDTFKAQHETLCALIFEPLVQGACGMGMYSDNYLKKAHALCSAYDIHLIADEIAVGFGRTGRLFACEHAGITPDFLCLSKGLTAGYLPMSCVLTTDSVYQAFLDTSLEKGFLHSHSFTGNPLAATAALASLAVFDTEQVLHTNKKRIALISKRLAQLKQNDKTCLHRQTGMIAAFTLQHADSRIGRTIHQFALTQGVLIRPIGQHVYIMPPYCITDDEINRLFDVINNAIQHAMTQHKSPSVDLKNVDPKLLA